MRKNEEKGSSGKILTVVVVPQLTVACKCGNNLILTSMLFGTS
jgi:hypothetical protein